LRKKSKSKAERDVVRDSAKAELLKKRIDANDTPSPTGSPGPSSSSTGYQVVGQTDAQKRFEEVQRRRMQKRVAQLAKQTHKDRVHEFNEKLESLSEHHDIPKASRDIAAFIARLIIVLYRLDQDNTRVCCSAFVSFMSPAPLSGASLPRLDALCILTYDSICPKYNLDALQLLWKLAR
ncbi:hypothetical protein DL93DRAFT_2050132, partial [Clavulina sp. PMI_390]